MWRFSAEVTHEDHRRTIDGDRRLEVQASGETRGNPTECGATEGSTKHAGKSSI